MQQAIKNSKQQFVEILNKSFENDQDKSMKFTTEEESFVNQVDQINEEVILMIEKNESQQALLLLQKAEKMLDFLANCGKPIDRNLIIVILYNEASVYQTFNYSYIVSLWELDKSQRFVDGVIYNLELLISENQPLETNPTDQQIIKIKRLSFLSRVYLQYCAVLSQLGQHDVSLQYAKKSVSTLNEMFNLSHLVSKTFLTKNESIKQKTKYQNTKEGQQLIIEEVYFGHLVVQGALKFLNSVTENLSIQSQDEKISLLAAQKQVYFWKNNPENNEKHLREQLNVPLVPHPNNMRSLIGVQNEMEWIEQFNIGTLMHISPIQYSSFALQGELLYEFSKKILLEKALYLSIAYFTIATEMRFVEIDKTKILPKGELPSQTKQFKLSVLYHLKSIEIACRHVQCKSPYIDHLISSFHKHYNQTLEPIAEEISYISQIETDLNTNKQSVISLPQKSHTAQQFKVRSEIEYMNDTDIFAQSIRQQHSLKKDKKNDDENKQKKKKLSIEGLKHMLQTLQEQAVQNTMTGQRNKQNQSRYQTEGGSSLNRQKVKDFSSRCSTQIFEKNQLKSLSIGQLKQLKLGILKSIMQDLENKKKLVQSPWNKSLNELLAVEQRKQNDIHLDNICKTERSNEDNFKLSKSYSVKFPKNNYSLYQQPLSQTKSLSMNQVMSSVNLNTPQQSSFINNKKDRIIVHTHTPQSQHIKTEQCQTLNINIGQNYITVKQDNKQHKSQSNYQQPSYQKRINKVDPRFQSELISHVNKMESIHKLLWRDNKAKNLE